MTAPCARIVLLAGCVVVVCGASVAVAQSGNAQIVIPPTVYGTRPAPAPSGYRPAPYSAPLNGTSPAGYGAPSASGYSPASQTAPPAYGYQGPTYGDQRPAYVPQAPVPVYQQPIPVHQAPGYGYQGYPGAYGYQGGVAPGRFATSPMSSVNNPYGYGTSPYYYSAPGYVAPTQNWSLYNPGPVIYSYRGYTYAGGRTLPPMGGFGSPYYNGYNDPNLPYYGRGVQDFIRLGGADFYGW